MNPVIEFQLTCRLAERERRILFSFMLRSMAYEIQKALFFKSKNHPIYDEEA